MPPTTPRRPPVPQPPIVLCAGGLDPSGGAGLVADAEAVRAAGAHAFGLVTCLTTQDTCRVAQITPQLPRQLAAQWQEAIADSPVAAIKIGLLGDAQLARAVGELLEASSHLPVVLDPVLKSGAGDPLADMALIDRLRNHLLARCSLITPNLPEAQSLSGKDDPDDCARDLLQTGCRWVLITGTHAAAAEVINRLYGQDGSRHQWTWPRLPHEYHGSGCTLASAIAARLAYGHQPIEAVAEAQAYTWETLLRARRTGRCQLTPNRLFALDDRTAATR